MNDLIRRKELYHDMAIKSLELHEKDLSWSEFIRGFNFAMEFVKNLPSVEPEQKKGKWKNVALFTRECSECGAQFHELEYDNFCPSCGSDMRMRGE